jgi:hypothetical protein
MKFVSGFALLLLLAPQTRSLAQDGTTRIITLSGDLAFELTGNYKDFFSPVINDSSNVAFSATSTTSTTASPVQAIYRTTPSGLQTIAKSGQTAPVLGGTLKTFSDIRLNSTGLVSFFATNGVNVNNLPKTAVYTSTGAALSTIASYGQPAPGLTGNATIFTSISLSDSGSVAFKALISDGSGDTSTPNGLYLSNSATSTTSFNTSTIATTNNTAPIIGGLFTDLDPTIVQNNLGTSLFLGYGATNTTTDNTAAGLYSFSNNSTTTIVTTSNTAPVLNSKFLIFTAWSITPSNIVNFSALTEDYQQGIFSSNNGVTTALVTTNDLAPNLGGKFTGFSSPSFSASGLVAFKSTDGSLYNNEINEHFGVFTHSNGITRALATTRQVAPQIGSNFTDFSSIETNDIGTTAFLGSTATGSVLCLSDGQDLVTAAFTSQIVSTSTIKSISFSSANDSDGASGLNNLGQVVYLATLGTFPNSKKSLLTFTPTLHFRTPSSGSWSTPANWTLSLTPAPVHDLVVDPSTPLTITGPASPTTINRLTIGSGSATANLHLQSSGPLSATNGITIASLGKISGDGLLIAHVSNSGSLSPGLPAAPGSLAFTGNLSLQSTSHLSLDLGGLIRKSHYDYLAISGALSLHGNLDVSLINGFSPQVGHSFDLFDASSVSGNFSLLNLPSLSSGLGWNTSLLPSTGVISVVAVAPVAATWTATGNGSWSTSATANWSPAVPNAPSTSATFTTTSPSPSTVTLGNPVIVGHLAFSSSSPYLLTSSPSDSLTLSDPSSTPSITVTTGSNTIATPILLAQNTLISIAANSALTLSSSISVAPPSPSISDPSPASSLSISGPGTVNLSGSQNYSSLQITNGTTNLSGAFTTPASISVTGSTTSLKFSSVSQSLTSLSIGAGSTVTFASPPPVSATWIANGNGSWSTSASANWSPAVPNAPSASATFGPSSSPTTIDLPNPITVGHLSFSSSSPYLLTSSPSTTLTLSDPSSTPSIIVSTGSATINSPIILAQNTLIEIATNSSLTLASPISGSSKSLTSSGPGTLHLSGNQNYSSLQITNGTTNLSGTFTTPASISVSGSSSLKISSVSQSLTALSIGAGSTVTFASFSSPAFTSSLSPSPVPEPSSTLLLFSTLLPSLLRRRRPPL